MVTIHVKQENIDKVQKFARDMVEKGYQREIRTGGTKKRSKQEIYNDIIEGRYAEYAYYQYIISNKRGAISEPDLEEWVRGEWDEGIDFKQNSHGHEYIIEIKASSEISRLVLLTAKDLIRDEGGRVKFEHGDSCPDFIIGAKVNKKTKTVTFPGYITKEDLNKALKFPKEYLWRKGELIPGTTSVLDADNYIWVYPDDSKAVNNKSNRKVKTARKFPDHHKKY